MLKIAKSRIVLLAAVSVVGLTSPVNAQTDTNVESVTVTGSRVITDITESPTPLTVLPVDQLLETTPTDIPDALNKLPEFIGGRTPRTEGNEGSDNSGNVLNLRNLGVSRTIVLLDGHRVPASNQDGTVDIDTLPQMLMSRVDVVTGGASAVYGSDAVAGVVNFVLDKKFDGFKYNLNAGISSYGDGAERQFGAAWGTDLFGGRGHFEASARAFYQDMVPMINRPYSYNDQTWQLVGAGTAASPFTFANAKATNLALHGSIVCGASCPANNYTFSAPGVIVPSTVGIPTPTANLEVGGDGGFGNDGTFQSKVRTDEFFSRFSYDISDNVNAYIQGSWAESGNLNRFYEVTVRAAASTPNTFFSTNPYLTPTAQAALGAGFAGGAQQAGYMYLPAVPATALNGSTPPAPPLNTPVFTAAGYQFNEIGGVDAGSLNDLYATAGVSRNLDLETGLTGTLLNKLNWDAYYNHGETRTAVKSPHNVSDARYLAAEDAVIAPSGTTVNGANVAGTVQCYVTTVPAFAALYPGCVPLNLFDPSGPSPAAYNYITTTTDWQLTQVLDNVGASISGGLWGLGLPAGEITASLSSELRFATYDLASNFSPTATVSCTGLRFCLANGPAPVLWVHNVDAPVSAANNVYEFATELNIPLLKDVPLFQEVSTDIAGRYTNYSTSGVAYTWKIGGDWHVNDDIRFRGALSVDIRAPNLNDLYQPATLGGVSFNDLLTKQLAVLQQQTSGNSALTPEIAHTYSLGTVLTPHFIPGLTASLDYYTTHIANAITSISPLTASIQNLCYATAPLYNSPYCSLEARPLAPGNPNYTSAANFPTLIYSEPFNTARAQMEGWDFELDYNWDMQDLFSWFPGSVNFRHLATYEPVNQSFAYPGASVVWVVESKTRQTTFLNYQVGDWGLAMQNQWFSGFKQASAVSGQIYAAPRLRSFDTLDVTIDRKFDLWGGRSDLYFSVSNITNAQPPLYATNTGNPGLYYPTASFENAMGRYFTIGIKGNL